MGIGNLVKFMAEAESEPTAADISIHLVPDRQAAGHTCGAACLGSVLDLYGIDLKESQLAKELHATREGGIHPDAIIECAKKHGVKAEVLEGMTIGDLNREMAAGNPVIVAFQAWGPKGTNYATSKSRNHYAVVIGVTGQHVLFMDPLTRSHSAWLPIDDFKVRWHNEQSIDGKTRVAQQLGIVFSGKHKRGAEDLVKID